MASSIPFDPKDKIVVVTGGASGIGTALLNAYAEAGAKVLIVSDINLKGAEEVARDLEATYKGVKAVAILTDVGSEDSIVELVEYVETEHGPIGMFAANAGVIGDLSEFGGGVDISEEVWMAKIRINFLQHAWVAKHLIPRYIGRVGQDQGGHILITASAAGLLTQIGSATYAATKSAAVAMAEWLAVTYSSRGVGVSCLCPQAVDTPMTQYGPGVAGVDGMMQPDEVAQITVEAQRQGKFLVLPHKEVAVYIKRKAGDVDRWLSGMVRLQDRFAESMGLYTPKAKL